MLDKNYVVVKLDEETRHTVSYKTFIGRLPITESMRTVFMELNINMFYILSLCLGICLFPVMVGGCFRKRILSIVVSRADRLQS